MLKGSSNSQNQGLSQERLYCFCWNTGMVKGLHNLEHWRTRENEMSLRCAGLVSRVDFHIYIWKSTWNLIFMYIYELFKWKKKKCFPLLVRFILTTILDEQQKLIIPLTSGTWKLLSCTLKPVLEFTCIETCNISAAELVSCVCLAGQDWQGFLQKEL